MYSNLVFQNHSFSIIFLIVLCFSCSFSDKNHTLNRDPGEVVVWELNEPQSLHPVLRSDELGGRILGDVFMTLLGIDPHTLEPIAILADSLPTTENVDGKMHISYRLRSEALWDNGEKVTTKDIVFSLKAMKNPLVNNPAIRPYYEFIETILPDQTDSLRFTIVSNNTYVLSEIASGGFFVLQKSFYDPQNLMDQFSLKELNKLPEELKNNEKIIEFARFFNSDELQREAKSIKGCGAYSISEWVAGQQITLERKANWWGDNVINKNIFFQANAPKLVYKIVNDNTTAMVALKGGNFDIAANIPASDFTRLKESDKYNANYTSHSTPQLEYNYIGLNTNNPVLKDKKTRQALAHLCDVEKMIELIQYGLAERINGPVHPLQTKDYNSDLPFYDYDIETATKLLLEAGWIDTNENGILDKEMNGKLTEFELDFIYNAGNEERKSVAMLFQESAGKAGIKINLIAKEWSVFMQELMQHTFDICIGGWSLSPFSIDHKQIYHTESQNGGFNFTGFGDSTSDAIIDSLRICFDVRQRSFLNKKLQQLLHDEVSYVYLYSRNNNIAIHKRFSKSRPFVLRPGYQASVFELE